MEEDIADEEKDCSRGEGNELSQLGLFEVFFGWRWRNCVWELKIELEVHKSAAAVDMSGAGVWTEGAGDGA